jgi:hypothetical protein
VYREGRAAVSFCISSGEKYLFLDPFVLIAKLFFVGIA